MTVTVVWTMLLPRLPLLIVFAVAIGLAVRSWPDHRPASALAIAGFLLHAALQLFSVWHTGWILAASERGESHIQLNGLISMILPIVSAGAHALVAAALYCWWQDSPKAQARA